MAFNMLNPVFDAALPEQGSKSENYPKARRGVSIRLQNSFDPDIRQRSIDDQLPKLPK